MLQHRLLTLAERLQQDTERRMRLRMLNHSTSHSYMSRPRTPMESLVLSSSRMSTSRDRCSKHECQHNSKDLTFQPKINPHSHEILKNKFLAKSKITKQKQHIYDDEEYSNPADIEEIARSQNEMIPFQSTQSERISAESPSQQNYYVPPVSNRVYVPMFTKPFDIDKMMGKNCGKGKITNKPKLQKSSTKTEIRPLLRPIADSHLTPSENYYYQQIVKDRIGRVEIKRK